MILHLTATTEQAGQRLDAFVAAACEGVSRSAAARLLEGGFITVNGRAATKSARIADGDSISVELPEAEETEVAAQDIPLDVVYEDDDVIVVNKPAGLVVHPAPGHPDGTLVNALLHHCGDSLSGVGGEKRPGIVHRIDRDTSGLIIAAKMTQPTSPSRPSFPTIASPAPMIASPSATSARTAAPLMPLSGVTTLTVRR